MVDRPARVPPITYLSLAVACFSLGTAMYQGWLQTRNLEAVQRDIARREQIRGCREVIEAYFEVKLRVGLLLDGVAAPPGEGWSLSRREAAAAAVSRMGAIGTFLANVEGDEARARYTALTRELDRVVAIAGAPPVADRAALFAESDRLFGAMNADCVRSARLSPS